ncbi:decarboxylase [Archangium violaceum]|uniref:pyridoxal phosphate-dependent decarboxylase family protein n=1 Tax=Archangium violaceum TaxID=83451 RepID=UPI00194DDD09|nr:pyridoxal-dependent decarboxylase [Archangium violaceum]QRN94179.1 decarboxylase [Archangium violaceum]
MSEKFHPNYGGAATESLRDALQKRLRSNELTHRFQVTAQPREAPAVPGDRQVEAWFLGPRAENAELFEQLVVEALRDHAFWRRNFHPSDPPAITQSIKRDPGYLQALDTLHTEFDTLLAELKKSAPFFSMRYQGHMTWDQTIPGMAGYFAAMMYNQNNVALEASPLTTVLEVRVGQDLCRMLAFPEHEGIKPWGHLTSGGTTANIEAMWAARNLKFYPLSLQAAIHERPELAPLKDFRVTLPSGRSALLVELDTWRALNLGVDEVLGIPARIEQQYGASHGLTVARLTQLVSDYTLQDLGLVEFTRRHLNGVGSPVFLVPGSKHYSLPKAAAILGLGADHMYSIPLDVEGRMDVARLEAKLDQCLAERRPVIAVVAVLGTTEEGLVDPLAKVLALRRDKYRPADIEFCVHADAAWGGYFASLLREPPQGMRTAGPTPALSLSTYVTEQYLGLSQADTVTLDPHKTGYLPYPAGAMCYRNGAMRSLVAFEAPYINTAGGQEELTVGKYGVEGSKPGAAAAGVYLSHAVIPPDQRGYGQILGRALYNCKMFHAGLLLMNEPSDPFLVVPGPRFQLPPSLMERYGGTSQALERLRHVVRGKSSASLFSTAEGEDLELLREIGADLNIVTYAFNFKTAGGLNPDMSLVNLFNRKIYDRLGVKADGRDIYGYQLLVSTTDFIEADYGKVFFEDYQRRLLGTSTPIGPSEGKISVLRSVIMDPWIAEDLQGRPFIETIMEEMRSTVLDVLKELQESGELPS